MRVITGKAKGHTLKAPNNMLTRPMLDRVKESLFAILEGYGPIRGPIADLFAGSGALGIEALSRGASWGDFVEQRAPVCRIIADNLAHTHFTDQARVHQMPVARFLAHARPAASYAIIFMDPPYADPSIEQIIETVAASALGEPGSLLVVGHSVRRTLADSYPPLQRIEFRRTGDSCFSIFTWPEESIGLTLPTESTL
jgi:16S rRNA (guanine(966)-N(2))-methyltransferase RsmD